MGDYVNMSVVGGKLDFLMAQPFFPFIAHTPPETFSVEFNQGYVFDYSAGGTPETPIEISGMGGSFELAQDQKWFYVTMNLGSSDEVVAASFSMSGEEPPASEDDIKYILVCKFDKNILEEFYLRDNIHFGGSGEGGDSSLNYTIYYAYPEDDSVTLTLADIYADYDPTPIGDGGAGDTNLSIDFTVTDGTMTKVVAYSDSTDRFADDGGDPIKQTRYSLLIVQDGTVVSSGGVYEEDTTCINGKGWQILNKIG